MLTSNEAQAIAVILRKRVVPKDAEEGAALLMLATKVVSHFAPQNEPQQHAQQPGQAPTPT
jgi:hypothetical protein